MGNIDERLDRVRNFLNDKDFLEGNGLSNEVNIRIFCYDPKVEMHVRYFVERIINDHSLLCTVKENNLYEIFLECCKDKRILDRIPEMEKRRGKDKLQEMLEKSITVKTYVDKITEKSFEKNDVILLTGIGDVFPFMRIHNLLEALQPKVDDTPIIVMYPGKFDGRNLQLFNRLEANPYYRAFNII